MSKIREYLEGRRGLHLKKKTAKEWASSCPWCGGTDRFVTFENEDRYWCRRCHRSGDFIQMLIELEGMDFKAAADAAGKVLRPPPVHKTITGRKAISGDNLSHPSHGKPDKAYSYLSANGQLVFRVCRWDVGETRDKKVFSPVSADGKSWSTQDIQQCLFNIPDIVTSKIVYFVEGEKSVEAVKQTGLAATTTPGGTSNISSLVEKFDILSPLDGKIVYVIPDQDDPGKEFAEKVATYLFDRKVPVKIVHLPDGGKRGYDVADCLQEKGVKETRELLLERANHAKPFIKPKPSMTLTELLRLNFERRIDVIQDVLPDGAHMLIAGEAGIGKSILRSELALHLVYGKDWLDLRIPKPKRVTIMQWENTELMEKKRLTAMLRGMGIRQPSSSLEFANNKQRWDLSTKTDQKAFIEFIKRLETEVLIYDCLSNMHTSRENDNIKMRNVLDALSDVNNNLGTTCILIHHFGKPGDEDVDEKYRIRGASSLIDWAVTAATFTAWAKSGEDEADLKDYRRFNMVKLRDAPPRAPLYCERSRETFLLERILTYSEIIRDWISGQGGEYTEGKEKMKQAMVKYLRCSERNATKHITQAVSDGLLIEQNVGNKFIYKAEDVIPETPTKEVKAQQGTFDWA